jgi:hypothetical protein
VYEIERKETRAIIRVGAKPIYNGALESFLVYKEGSPGIQPSVKVSKVKDLTDEQLLFALANVVELKELSAQ